MPVPLRRDLAGQMLRSLGVVPMAIAGAAALAVSPALHPALTPGWKTVVAQAKLLNTESWIMGGSGIPIPPPSYLDGVSDLFIDPAAPWFPGQPLFPVDAMNGLFTPEGLYPNSGVKSLELDTSLAQGVSILRQTIANEVADGNNLVVLGASQSATISTMVMRDLLALPPDQQPTAEQLAFVLLGDPNNPNGGLFERMNVFTDGGYPTIPSLGITFNGATPAETPWHTAIYTGEYDGYADFPRYPINLLADLNAVLGIVYVHTTYPSMTPEQLAAAIELPVSDGYAGNTQYFMIPTETLPLLAPLQSIPVIGQPLYELLEPDLRILINLGYGSITNGWDDGPADVGTPYSLFPTDLDWGEVASALAAGAQQGFNNFVDDLAQLSTPSPAELAGGPTGDAVALSMPSLTDFVNALTSAASSAYAALLPTADLVNALLTTAPLYAANLFAQEVGSGDFLDAVGMPVAGLFGLGSIALGYEYIVVSQALSQITADFQGLFAA